MSSRAAGRLAAAAGADGATGTQPSGACGACADDGRALPAGSAAVAVATVALGAPTPAAVGSDEGSAFPGGPGSGATGASGATRGRVAVGTGAAGRARVHRTHA